MRVTIAHVRGCSLCAPGARLWFARYGLSWADFVRDGIDDTTLLATGDAFAQQVVEFARQQGQDDGRR